MRNHEKRSVSPKLDTTKKNTTPIKVNYQHFAQKLRSIWPLNQDNYVNVKTTNTPPKTVGPKSTHELDNKSPRLSVDEIPQPKKSYHTKKGSK